MGIVVNSQLLATDEDSPAGADKALPAGVFKEEIWDDWASAGQLPEDRVELFRVNGRVYTGAKQVNLQIVFRYMKALRLREDTELAMADLLYGALGEPVMDVLASEGLSVDEYKAVMKVAQKYIAGAAKQLLGN